MHTNIPFLFFFAYEFALLNIIQSKMWNVVSYLYAVDGLQVTRHYTDAAYINVSPQWLWNRMMQNVKECAVKIGPMDEHECLSHKQPNCSGTGTSNRKVCEHQQQIM